jgi:hypothetical protein
VIYLAEKEARQRFANPTNPDLFNGGCRASLGAGAGTGVSV